MAKAFVGSNPTPRTTTTNLGVISMYLKRLGGRKSVTLKDMINDPMIVELKNGKIYGGRLDEYYYNGGGVVALYSCKLLDKIGLKWVDHDIMVKVEDKLIRRPMPDFWIADIKDIFVLPEEHRDKLSLEDTLQIYIDPHYKPLTGVQCNWEPGENWEPPEENHTPECDARLHEALSFLLTVARRGNILDSKDRKRDWERRRLRESFAYVRRRLLMYGAEIP